MVPVPHDRRINFCEHGILNRRLTAIKLFNTQLNLGSQLFTGHQQTDAINDCRFFGLVLPLRRQRLHEIVGFDR